MRSRDAEVAADLDRVPAHLPRHAAVERDAVRRAVDDADELLPALDRAHDLLRAAADRRRRIVRVQRQPHARLLRLRHHRLQEVGDVRPHLVERVRALVRERRQVLHPLVVEAGPAGAGAAGLLEVAFHRAVRVPVVFDHRQADLARGPDRLDHLLDVLVLAGPVVDRVVEARDHQVRQRQAVGLEAGPSSPRAGLRPRESAPPPRARA